MEDQTKKPIEDTLEKQIKDAELEMTTQRNVAKIEAQLKNNYKAFQTPDDELKKVYVKQGESSQKKEEDAKKNIKNLQTRKAELEKTKQDVAKLGSQFGKDQVSSEITNMKMESIRLLIRNIISEIKY